MGWNLNSEREKLYLEVEMSMLALTAFAEEKLIRIILQGMGGNDGSVSYTHLTLPTKLSV